MTTRLRSVSLIVGLEEEMGRRALPEFLFDATLDPRRRRKSEPLVLAPVTEMGGGVRGL